MASPPPYAGSCTRLKNRQGPRTSGDVHRFAECDVFTFTGDLIGRVESYLVPLAPPRRAVTRGRGIARG
jgi:hypothetical protein